MKTRASARTPGTRTRDNGRTAAKDRQDQRQDVYGDTNYYYGGGYYPPPPYGGYYYDDDDDEGAALVAGLVVGAVIGSAAASSESTTTTTTTTPAPTTNTTNVYNQMPAPGNAQLPCNPAVSTVNGVTYYQCGNTYYTQAFGSSGPIYMPVQPPS